MNNKKILSVTIALLSSGFLFGGSGLNIPRTSVFIPSKIGDVALTFNKDHFSVSRNGQQYRVKSYDVDPALRNLKVAGLTAFLKQDGRLSLSKRGDDYAVKMTSGLKGGGYGGATFGFYLGKTTVYVVSYSAIYIVSLAAGPAQPVAFATMSAYATPVIDGASNVVGLGTGIITAASTGPV